MAISAVHYRLLQEHRAILPQGGRLLEIGEANWYGDMAPDFPCRDTRNLFTVAKDCYRALFAPRECVAVDWHGTPAALRLDLNGPVSLPGKFDIAINHGTAEHVFNIAQVFRTMHDHCSDGGLMIHESPFTGWIDHGFYCLQPTLFYDLAAANGYEIVSVSVTVIDPPSILRLEGREHAAGLAGDNTLPNNAMLFVVYRKRGSLPFKVPVQGYYAQTLSEAGAKAWRELR